MDANIDKITNNHSRNSGQFSFRINIKQITMHEFMNLGSGGAAADHVLTQHLLVGLLVDDVIRVVASIKTRIMSHGFSNRSVYKR